jgi:AbrB family looped-hinge helix DNA binding protein
MKTLTRTDSVSFTTKGQVVIPARLRRQFHIETGTRAIVQATDDGILLKPITSVSIRRLRGLLKSKPGAPSLAEEWSEHKRQERELEDAGHGRQHRS